MNGVTVASARARVSTRACKVAAAAFLTLLLFSLAGRQRAHASDNTSQDKKKNPLPATLRNTALGLDHFNAHCTSCHGRSGKADTDTGKAIHAADLTAPDVQSRSDGDLFGIISNGVSGKGMPGFAKTHSAIERWQMVLFLRKLPGLTEEERKKLESAVPANARHKHGGEAIYHPPTPVSGAQDTHTYGGYQPVALVLPAATHPLSDAMLTPVAWSPKEIGQAEQQEHHHEMQMEEKKPAPESQKQNSSGPKLTLPELEQMALKSNPTLAQADAAIRAAEGRKKQAGLYPNPTIGYSGQELAFRSLDNKSEHFFFVEQDIITGGKLSKSRRVVEGERAEAVASAEGQKMRVLNTVRMLYYEALGAQQTLDLQTELVRIAGDATHTSEQLLNVGQADEPDLLEAENEAEHAQIDLVQAENDRDHIWQMLAAVVGNPDLPATRLAGSLEGDFQMLDEKSLLSGLLSSSPEIKQAEAGVQRAKAAVARAEAERAPDLFVRGEIGYSTELLETRAGVGGRTGPEAAVEFGARLRLFDRNQGNIAAAGAELTEAQSDLERRKLALQARFAAEFRDYEDSFKAAQRYKEGIIPRSQKAYDLYSAKFREMAAAYPQVIIAQRNLYQARQQYVRWLVALQQSSVKIKGFLLSGGLDAPSLAATSPSGMGAGETLRPTGGGSELGPAQ